MIMVYYVTIGYMQFMKMNNDKTTIDNGQKYSDVSIFLYPISY